MSETVTKTLQATLAPPTTGKEQRLQNLLDTYRDALHDAFGAGANTMSAVNDVVTPYDLPYQAKDALKSYVPKLRKTYNARELDDEHPLRLVNRAAKYAAANIASRVDPWGESVPWESERDDSPRNGRASDSATVHRETSENSSQMTLAADSD